MIIILPSAVGLYDTCLFGSYGFKSWAVANVSLNYKPHSLQIYFSLSWSLTNKDFQKLAYWSLKVLRTGIHSPWSMMTIWCFFGCLGLGLTKIFPGWGSQWTKPVTKICSAKAVIIPSMIYFLLKPSLFISYYFVILIPSIHSVTRTLSLVN